MHMESTLGGVALSADGSSWPTVAEFILDDIGDLEISASVSSSSVSSSSELEDLRKEVHDLVEMLKEILITMACGIEESHLMMDCVYLSAKPYAGHTAQYLKDGIKIIKSGAACAGLDLIAMRRSFENANKVHTIVKPAYQADLEGGESPNQETLIRQIVQVLNEKNENA